MADARSERNPAVRAGGAGGGSHVEERRGGPFNFVHECWAELKKVEWPGQNQVIQGTVVVLVACAIAGVYLWLNDQLWKEVVQKLILGQ
jgi:preprotein translocase subunit SecE